MVDQDQQDFDEFDTLVDDSIDPADDLSFDRPDTNRKKRQTVFYLILIFILVLGASSVWFVFLRQPDTGLPTSLQPVVENENTAPQLSDNNGLPPGVSSPDTGSVNGAPVSPENASIVPIDPNSVNPEVATPQIASPEIAAVENEAPANATVTSTGMTVEALPPPADVPPAPLEDGVAPAPEATVNTTNVTPAIPDGVAPDASIMPPVETTAVTTPPAETTAIAPEQPEIVTPVTAPAMVAPIAEAIPTAVSPEISQRLNQIEEQVKSLSSNPAVATTGGDMSALAEQIKALNDKLDRLNQQVDSLDQRTTTFATELQSRDNNSAPKAAPAPKPVKKAVKKAAPKPVAKSYGSSWELRSAQPGVAWLGKPGSNEMSRFAIGQTAPGLGTIQAVTQEGGRWIVKTSGGTLRQ